MQRFPIVPTILILTATTLWAQQTTTNPGAGSAAVAQSVPQNKAVDLMLDAAAGCRDAEGKPKKACELGDPIVVGFINLREWMEADQGKNKPADLVLVLDNRVMKGLNPRGPDVRYKELEFDMKRLGGDQAGGADNRDDWNALLSRSKTRRVLQVGVALGGTAPYFGPATITVQVFPSYSPLIVAFLLALLVLLVLMARMSDILRDAPSPDGGPRTSYSLARCQMAFWFFIIVGAYNYIWMVTGDRDSITQGALILMGISAATGLGATVVDSSKRDQRQSLGNERDALTARLAGLAAGLGVVPPPANLTDLQSEQQQKQARLAAVQTALSNLPSPPGASTNFVLDILRDETGVSIHRFQMAAWTIVLGFVFIVAVTRSLAMPDFNATLLGLMGISSGTYVGFKIPDPPK